MSKVMKASELVRRHIDVAKNYKTVYMWGCFGSPVSGSILNEKSKQYPSWYTAGRLSAFRQLIGEGYFGFDCVNLTKGILWGWDGSRNAYHGGAKYASNGVTDVSADGMIKLCTDVSSTGWDKLIPGEGLWMSGHWGLYIGDGLAVECTPIWADGVQITAVGNIGAKAGYNSRKWTKHGKIPWVDYDTETVDTELAEARETIKQKAGLADTTMAYLENYQYGADLIKKLAKAMT